MKKMFYWVWYLNFNRIIYSVLQELDIDLDLTAVFSLKKSPDSSQIEHIGNINITEALKHFQYGEFKTRLVQIYLID